MSYFSVYQMSLLEAENMGDGTSQGVILALVGPEYDGQGSDSMRSLRMYNLTSLVSLARWAIAQPVSSHWSIFDFSLYQRT